jgi:YVTN family beta-propeller protein
MKRFLVLLLAGLVMGVGSVAPALQTHAANHSALTAAQRTKSATLSTQIETYLTGLAAKSQLSGAVLVARHGTVLLSQGYGMADREHKVPNAPTTKYPLAGISFAMSLVAGLKLEEQGTLHDSALICAYLSSCPAAWKALTIGMVLDNTAGLPNWDWEHQGSTVADSLAGCQSAALSVTVDYQNCTVIVLGTIFEKVTGTPWATVLRAALFGPAGMTHSGRMTDAMVPPVRASAYSGDQPNPGTRFNTYFSVYATLKDVYAYDDALFGGKILSQQSLQRLLTPKSDVSPPDAGIAAEQQAAQWKVGTLGGHRVVLTTGSGAAFTAANVRFPNDDVTVIVLSNEDQNDVEAVAVHLAGLVFSVSPTTAPSGAPAITVAVGSNPVGVAVDEATHTVYVANGNGGTVSMISSASCNAINTSGCGDTPTSVKVGAGPLSVLLVRRTHTVYVTNMGGNTVSMIDEATCNATTEAGCLQKQPTVTVGANPSLLDVNLADDTVYVANAGAKSVSVIDGDHCNATGTTGCSHIGTVSVGASPDGLSVDQSTGMVYVANHDDNTVSVIDGTTCNAKVHTGCGQTPPTTAVGTGPAASAYDDAAGTVYVASGPVSGAATSLGSVAMFNTASCRHATWPAGCRQTPHMATVGSGPIAVALNHATHTVYVGNQQDGTVSVLDDRTCNARVTKGCRHTPATLATAPDVGALDVDPATNTVYVSSQRFNTVSVLDGGSCNASIVAGCTGRPV